MENQHRKGALYAILTASMWGFMPIVLKIMTSELPSVTVVWFRFFMAFVVLSFWSLFFRPSDFSIFRRPPWRLIITAAFLALNYTGFIVGVNYATPASAQIFIQIGPVGFALSGILIFKEHVNWRHIVGFVLVLAGMLLFYSEQLSALREGASDFRLGMLLVLGGGISWAIFATLQKTLVRHRPINQLNLFIYGFCALLVLPFTKFSSLQGLSAVNWTLLIYLGLNTVIAYGALALAMKYTEATRVSVIITLNPILTFLSMALLGYLEVSWIGAEFFSLPGILGAATVLSGAVTVIYAGRRAS
ncbi:MAG: EamA family transporter [Bacteroidetes bacterium]|nr:MAG: EamA family transporter [Bacteroidota bacterium]